MTSTDQSENVHNLNLPHDLAHQCHGLLNHVGGDIEVGAGPDPAVHHGKEHAALTQGFDHLVAGDAGAIGIKENEIGFGLLHLHAGNLR